MVVIYGHLLLIFMPLIICSILIIWAFICNIIMIIAEYKIKKINKNIEEIDKRISDLKQERHLEQKRHPP